MDRQLEEGQEKLRKLSELIHKAQSTKPIYNGAPILDGSALVLSDIQCPFQDGEFIIRMCNLANKWGITQGISNGDFFNQDAFTVHPARPEDKLWHEDAKAARDLAESMMKLVPDWLMIRGNHDNFLLRMTEMQLNHQDLMRLAGFETAFQATDFFYCIVKDKEGNQWRVSHPRNTSVIGGNVPAKLATKFKMNVVAGHGHLIGIQYDLSGTYLAIDSGVSCDPERLQYAQQRDNTRPRMTKGAVILKEVNGKIYPYHILPERVDWEAMERLYQAPCC